MNMDLSIVIVNWNAKDYLKKCVASIYEDATNLSFEIIIVDNASSDGSVEMVKFEFPKVRLINNSSNSGFGIANNIGIKESIGRYILFLNPDTLVLPDCLKKLMGFLDKNASAGAVGPKIINPDGSIQVSCARNTPGLWSEFFELTYFNYLFPKVRLFNRQYLGTGEYDTDKEVDLLSGSCMMVRRSVLDEIGLFDPSFFIYGEDIDLLYRIKKAGWKVWYLYSARLVHFGGESTKQVPEKKVFHNLRSKYLFLKKHFGRTKAAAYIAVVVISVIIVYLLFMPFLLMGTANIRAKARNLVSQNNRTIKWVLKRQWD